MWEEKVAADDEQFVFLLADRLVCVILCFEFGRTKGTLLHPHGRYACNKDGRMLTMTEALGDEGVSSSAATPTCRRGAKSNSGLNGLLVGGCFFVAQKEMWELCLVDGGKDVVCGDCGRGGAFGSTSCPCMVM